MKRLLLVLCLCLAFLFGPAGNRRRVFEAWDKVVGIDLAAFLPDIGFGPVKDWVSSLTGSIPAPGDAPVSRRQPGSSRRTWTFADGSEVDAVLVAADARRAQLRIVASQGVGQIPIELFSEKDRERILRWVDSSGTQGVAGYPLPLKNHRWPPEWRTVGVPELQRVEGTNQWSSRHFDFTNEAGVKPEALESIAMICEAVDGALTSLPLPLPVNWGRDPHERRKVLIENGGMEGMEAVAGYWDGRTGIVHIYTKFLLEPDLQLVVFEFDKPEKVQKYDVIVHEVVHQSTSALLHLGVPAWVPEGIAEYLAATHLAPGVYHFANSHVPVRHHINKRVLGDRIAKQRRLHLTRLDLMMGRKIPEWNAEVAAGDFAGPLQYNQALLMIDYFFHRDHPDGAHFRRYLEAVLSGAPEPEARELHLMRGRSRAELEREIIQLWEPLGFTINFQERGELRRGDVDIDWDAEEIKRTIATRRAMMDSGKPVLVQKTPPAATSLPSQPTAAPSASSLPPQSAVAAASANPAPPASAPASANPGNPASASAASGPASAKPTTESPDPASNSDPDAATEAPFERIANPVPPGSGGTTPAP